MTNQKKKAVQTLKRKSECKVGDATVPRVLWCSNNFNLNTGYGICLREFGHRLGTKFWVSHIAQQQAGGPFKPEGFNFEVLPYKDGNVCLLQSYIDKFKPAVVIVQDDSFTSVRDGLDKINFGKTKICFYTPHDGEIFANISKPLLDKCDKLVAMTNFGKEKLEAQGYEGVSVIYHGTDPKVFKPLSEPEKQEKRVIIQDFFKNVMGQDVKLENRFVVNAMGRNTLRKQFANLLRIWCKFAEGKDDVTLLVNSIGYDNSEQNMQDWVERTIPSIDGTSGKEVENGKVIFFPAQTYSRGIPVRMMADLMAMSDASLFCALGEGFSMAIAESIFCNVPVISHDYTTPLELVGKNRGFLFGSADWFIGGLGIPHKMPSVEKGVVALEKAYALWKKGELKGKFDKGFDEFKKLHTWDKKAKEWEKVILEVLE